MEQGLGDHIEFREVDQDGRAVDPDAGLQAAERVPERPNRMAVNPYIAALWVLTAVLIAGGLLLFTNAAPYMGPTFGPMPPLAFILLNFAPWAVLAGIMNAFALLFWHAFHWQRKRR